MVVNKLFTIVYFYTSLGRARACLSEQPVSHFNSKGNVYVGSEFRPFGYRNFHNNFHCNIILWDGPTMGWTCYLSYFVAMHVRYRPRRFNN